MLWIQHGEFTSYLNLLIWIMIILVEHDMVCSYTVAGVANSFGKVVLSVTLI